MTNLLRRYRYLQKQVKDAISKVINYLKSFTDTQRHCLAIYTALCIIEGMLIILYCSVYDILCIGLLSVDVINCLFAEHLVKEESLSLNFMINLFKTWISEKGISNVGSTLRKNKLEDQLLV